MRKIYFIFAILIFLTACGGELRKLNIDDTSVVADNTEDFDTEIIDTEIIDTEIIDEEIIDEENADIEQDELEVADKDYEIPDDMVWVQAGKIFSADGMERISMVKNKIVSITEVTMRQYQECVAANSCTQILSHNYINPEEDPNCLIKKNDESEIWLEVTELTQEFFDNLKRPVTCLYGKQMYQYMNWRSATEGLQPIDVFNGDNYLNFDTVNGYRLLTEDESLFVTKGGLNGVWESQYPGSNNHQEVCVSSDSRYNPVSASAEYWLPDEVATKLPNELGIFDLVGNAAEIIQYSEMYPNGALFPSAGKRSYLNSEDEGGCAMGGGDTTAYLEDIPPKISVGFRMVKTDID